MNKDKFVIIPVDELRKMFKKHLLNQDLSEHTINTRCSSAFYLYDNNDSDFKELLISNDFENEARKSIYNKMLEHSNSSDIMRDVNGYYNHVKTLREFIMNDDIPSKIKNTLYGNKRKSYFKYANIDIPTPNNEQVN